MDSNPPRFGRCPPPPPSSARATADQAFPRSDAPTRGSHRRAHSETILHLPDDFLFDDEPDFTFDDIEFPSLSDENLPGGSGFPAEHAVVGDGKGGRPTTGAHLRSLSVGAAFFEELGFQAGQSGGGVPDKKVLHRHSSSMDGSTSPFEAEPLGQIDGLKKAMAADKLAELALIDPKKAKRILANRQSAARSKERKFRYTSELESKVQTLQTEATTLSAHLTLLQRDTTGLTAENKELKLRLQAMEQQAHLREALNEALRDEVQQLKLVTGQIPTVNGHAFNMQNGSPFFSQSRQLHSLGGNQSQQNRMPLPSFSKGSHLSDSMDFI